MFHYFFSFKLQIYGHVNNKHAFNVLQKDMLHVILKGVQIHLIWRNNEIFF